MAIAKNWNHALPVLITGQSSSLFVLEGKGRRQGQLDNCSISCALARNHLPATVAASNDNQTLPDLIAVRLPASKLQKKVSAQCHAVSAVKGISSAPARDEPSYSKDVQAEPKMQEHQALTKSDTRSPQKLSTTGCFFADIGILSRTLVVTMGPGTWRDNLAFRLGRTDLPAGLQKHLVAANWRLHGKRIFNVPAKDLVDQVLRLDMPGLLGGMPASGKNIFRNLRAPEVVEGIDLDSDPEPQTSAASMPEQCPLTGPAASEVSQTLSGFSDVAAPVASQIEF